MNQCQMYKEENQSNGQSEDINQSVSESDRYLSSSNGGKKNQLPQTSEIPSSISYANGDWLIQLIKMNPFKMQQIIDWIHSLLGLMSGESIKISENIASLNFGPIKRNHQLYYIFIEEIDQMFSLFKIFDRSGSIVSFGFSQNSQKQQYLLSILKKMGKKVFVFILDETDGKNYLNDRLFECISPRIILTVRQTSNLAPKKLGRWGFSRILFNGTCYRYYLCVTKKLSDLSDIKSIIQNEFKIEFQNSESSYKMLNELNLEILGTVETRCLITNLIHSFQQVLTRQKMRSVLSLGLNNLDTYLKKWQENSESHFPGPASIKKILCKYCQRKRSEVICKGCTIIHGQETNLCIGPCFHKYHEQNFMFMKKQTTQIYKNMAFFDRKCKEIDKGMNFLAEGNEVEYVQFLNYLQAKVLNSLNKLTEKKNAFDDEENQANDP